jgi:hypothetical protein
MLRAQFIIGFLIFLGAPAAVYAAVQPCVLAAGARPDLACSVPQNRLPNVLYIGDSISIGTMGPLTQALTGTANICHIYANAGASNRGVQCTREWLNKTAVGVKWDYVLFNFGLHDVKLTPAGQPETSQSNYQQNLRIVANTIRRHGAIPIWVTTTPIPTSLVGSRFDNPTPYATISKQEMTFLNVPVIDTYSIILPNNGTGHPLLDVHWLPAPTAILSNMIAGALKGEIQYQNAE